MGGFIFQNSWGTGWGDGGYGLLPYSAFRDIAEAWVFRIYAGLSFVNVAALALKTLLAQIYVAVFSRAPDLGAYGYWGGMITAGTLTQTQMCDLLISSPEAVARYPTHGGLFLNLATHNALFANRVALASYCTIDLALANETVVAAAFALVDDTAASVDTAKLYARANANGAGGVL